MRLHHRVAGLTSIVAVALAGTSLAALPQTAPIDPYGRIVACLKACKQNSPPVLNCARQCMPTSVPTFPAAPPTGAPNGSLYVVTVGDSIMWGQGIPEGRKFPDLVTNWLQSLYGPSYYISRFPTFAHSGAPLQWSSDGPNVAPGEVPENVPSVLLQVDLTVSALANAGVSPTSVVLVLVDGCINDVTVSAMLNGINSSAGIVTTTNQDCAVMGTLLSKVGTAFPNAAVVVTGYYQFITSATDPAALAALMALGGAAAAGPWGGILGAVLGGVDIGRAQANSAAFASTAHDQLTAQVQDANKLLPAGAPPRFALAWPNFTADNGYAAPSTWLWKVGDFAGAEALALAATPPPPFSILIPFPFDPNSADAVAYYRAQWCMANNDLLSTCVDASMGHPNFLGVSAYTQAVIQQIETTLHARFPPPTTVPGTPPGVVVRVLTGSDTAGPIVTFAGVRTKLTHWLWVSVLDPHTGARIDHTPIAVRPSTPQQQAYGQGESFAKFYYLCKPEVIPPLRNSLAPPPPFIKTCAGTVSAAGFPAAFFSAPADPR
jgi:hypothetical protein